VTERTRDLLGERYLFRERGKVQVKGEGAMVAYFLVGRAGGHGMDGAGDRPVLVPASSWGLASHRKGAAP
jgi:hypothetical protein